MIKLFNINIKSGRTQIQTPSDATNWLALRLALILQAIQTVFDFVNSTVTGRLQCARHRRTQGTESTEASQTLF